MNKYLKIKGKDHDEKFSNVEKIMQRMSRRLHKTITVVVPPSPAFNYVEIVPENGVIAKCIFPAPGEVTRLCMAINEFVDKKQVQFDAELSRFTIHGQAQERFQKSFLTRKNIEVADLGFKVSVGDCLTLSTPTPELIKGVWTSLLYVIEMPEGKMKEIAYDELDALVEGAMEDEGVLS